MSADALNDAILQANNFFTSNYMPLFKKKAPKISPTMVFLIGLAVLLAVSMFVLIIKMDFGAGTRQSGRLQQDVPKVETGVKSVPTKGSTMVTQSVTVRSPAIDTSSWKDFSSADFSLKYPTSFKIELPTLAFKATVVRGKTSRVEIFKLKDFGGDRPFGFEPDNGTPSQKDIDGYVPKQAVTATGTRGTYDVWLFYGQGDVAANAEAQAIYESIKVK